MNRELVLDVVERLPQATLSRAWGWVVRRRRPRAAVELLKRVFVARTGIDMSEAADPISAYETLEDLFVRRLRSGARRVDPAPDAVVSPVDGTVGACGAVEAGLLLQVKGRHYSLSRLLDDAHEAKRYEGGSYATFYLSPRDYHRIHAPVAGHIVQAALIPGRLLPVFPEAVDRVDELFARNERLITYIDTPDAGRVAVVKVGATLVGRISVSYDPEVYTNRAGQVRRRLRYDPPKPIQKGADLGAFELGSTVVLLTEKSGARLDGLRAGAYVRVGERIGTLDARRPQSRVRRGGTRSKSPRGRSAPKRNTSGQAAQ